MKIIIDKTSFIALKETNSTQDWINNLKHQLIRKLLKEKIKK